MSSSKALIHLLENYDFSDLQHYPNVGINRKGEVEEFSYSGNFYLRNRNAKLLFTRKAEEEYDKCSGDFEYFARTYIKIETIDYGIQPFKLREWQSEAINFLHNKRKIVLNVARQSGKSTIIIAYILWLSIFEKDMKLGIVANRTELTSELMGMYKNMYMLLPPFLQHNIIKWNQRSIELSNGCKVVSAVAGPSALRGQTIKFLLCISGDKKVFIKDSNNIIKEMELQEVYEELEDAC